eukprot:SAG31_NODE_5645_length_2405_cov_1.681266_1_plen_212_part_00
MVAMQVSHTRDRHAAATKTTMARSGAAVALPLAQLAATLAFAAGGDGVVTDESNVTTLHVDAAAAALPTGATKSERALRTSHADGSVAHPFRSLQAAKDYIISNHAQNGVSGVHTVRIRAGRYAPIAIDHEALSGIKWRGAGRNLTIVSGGIEIPQNRFKPWSRVPGAYVASIAGLRASSLGKMVSGNEVSDCQNDKVGLRCAQLIPIDPN